MSTSTVAAEVRERALRSRDRFWRPEDFSGSPEAVAKALSRLARSGELRRIRRGLYWRGEETLLGMAPPPTDRLVREVVEDRGVGPASLSAALLLGLTTQVPRIETIAIPGRAPRNVRGVEFVSRNASTRRRDERLRPLEVALLETLRDWAGVVELPPAEAFDRIEVLTQNGAIRVDRVVRASTTEPPGVRERLRRLLIALNRSDDAGRVPAPRSEATRQDVALGF